MFGGGGGGGETTSDKSKFSILSSSMSVLGKKTIVKLLIFKFFGVKDLPQKAFFFPGTPNAQRNICMFIDDVAVLGDICLML